MPPYRNRAIENGGDSWTTNKDPLRSVLATRTQWKTSDSGEAIWSVKLEAALLEGLAQYKPPICKETVLLGRFPRRNQFISEYIWKQTGQRRSPKQIGSRLQQLRDSSQGQELAHLLFPSPELNTSSAIENHNRTLSLGLSSRASHVIIYIDILPGDTDLSVPPAHVPPLESQTTIHASPYPRRLACIDPTVTFISHSSMPVQSQFTVWTDHAVYSEPPCLLTSTIDFCLLDPTRFLYQVSLVPGFWKNIVESPGASPSVRVDMGKIQLCIPDPTRYTIFQEVNRIEDGAVMFSATYCFRYPTQYLESLATLGVRGQTIDPYLDCGLKHNNCGVVTSEL